jgi:membrane-associated phospholipid phosphatase
VLNTPNELLPRHRRVLLVTGCSALALSIAAVFTADGPVAVAVAALPSEVKVVSRTFVSVLEVLFAFGVSPYLYGALLVIGGSLAFRSTTNRRVPWVLLFVGMSHMTARFVGDILKPPFSRLRPYEALGSDGWHDTWFAAVGNSFPSGHAVHFWSLFFPLAVLFPRYGVPLAVLPTLVSVARIAVNDHYVSDVLASTALAAFVTLAYAVAVLERGSLQN